MKNYIIRIEGKRVLTTSIKVIGGKLTLKRGEVIIRNILNTEVNIIAIRKVEKIWR